MPTKSRVLVCMRVCRAISRRQIAYSICWRVFRLVYEKRLIFFERNINVRRSVLLLLLWSRRYSSCIYRLGLSTGVQELGLQTLTI